jgi:mRNA deadenylase 3'-5' endonuclease subunit Ccr4
MYPWTSKNALKVKPRLNLVLKELEVLDGCILTLQEVDNYTEIIQPGLDCLGYDTLYVKKSKLPGPNYLASLEASNTEKTASNILENVETTVAEGEHGICIAWKREMFKLIDAKTIRFDNVTGSSTGNVGMMVALQNGKDTIIVTNVHLWWRPDGQKKRFEQICALLDELLQWNSEKLPIIFSGDWNVNADDVLYHLMTGKPLMSGMDEQIMEIFGQDYETLRMRIPCKLMSIYQSYQQLDEEHSPDPAWKDGQGWTGEPSYTTYARCKNFGWSGTLDYIFLNSDSQIKVSSILQVPPLSIVSGGLPNDVFPSDHVPIGITFDVI